MQEHGSEKGEGLDALGAFIFMPEEAIKSLRSELTNLLGEKLAKGVLFRFGYRCGEALVERIMLKDSEEKGITALLIKIWEHTGLGKLVKIEEISEEEIAVEQEGSTEAQVIGSAQSPSCDYTRGYLAGIANMLTKKKFYCVETQCISEGKDRCKFQLQVFPHKVYVPEKK